MSGNERGSRGPQHETEGAHYFVIINQYASTPDRGMGGRHFEFARLMARMGHRVDLVMADYHHLLVNPRPKGGPVEIEMREGVRIIHLRVLRYANAHSPWRTVNWLLFAWRVARLDRYLERRPDAVLISSPSLLAYPGAERLARRHGARLCFEVRDIWPLSLVELGGFSPRHPLIWFLQRMEDRAYREADHVVSNLPAAVEHMKERGMDPAKFTWIPTGISIQSEAPTSKLDPDIRNLMPESFVVGYAGTIGLANALETLIDAAELLREHSGIGFVLVGEGRERARLERRVKMLGLRSVVFAGPVPKAQVAAVLKHFDVCYVGWQPRAIYRFGVAANKLAEYMAAGKPLIHSYTGYDDPVEAAGCGLSSPAGDARALADNILRMKEMAPDERIALGARGATYAARKLDNSKNVLQLLSVLAGQENPKAASG